MKDGHGWMLLWELITAAAAVSDVGERGGGDEAHGERAREVAVLAVALVAQVERVLLLPLIGVTEQDHLTQEGVHNHVLVVDLLIAHREQCRHPEKQGKEVRVREKKRGEKR